MTTAIVGNGKPFTVLLLLLLVFVLGVTAIAHIGFTPPSSRNDTYVFESMTLTVAEARIFELVSGHAWQEHGEEVNDAMRCLGDNGTAKSFKTKGFGDGQGNIIPTNLWLCTNGDDWFAIVSTKFQKIAGNQVARLVTAYKVGKDIFPTIDDFIEYITVKWGAYEINYVIEAGQNILLDPK